MPLQRAISDDGLLPSSRACVQVSPRKFTVRFLYNSNPDVVDEWSLPSFKLNLTPEFVAFDDLERGETPFRCGPRVGFGPHTQPPHLCVCVCVCVCVCAVC